MLKIAVCIKQVPAYSEANMDPITGVLIRQGLKSIMNKNDIYALETALRIKDEFEDILVDVFTMGPPSSEEIIREAYCLGADNGFVVSDKRFAGADVFATSYTLFQSISSQANYDLVICGKQTTDGDTGQVCGAIAKWLKLPCLNWVEKIDTITQKYIIAVQNMGDYSITVKANFPCVISVEPEIFIPRVATLKLKMASKKKQITYLSLENFEDKNEQNYGLKGSATRVKKIFFPSGVKKHKIVELNDSQAAEYILRNIKDELRQ